MLVVLVFLCGCWDLHSDLLLPQQVLLSLAPFPGPFKLDCWSISVHALFNMNCMYFNTQTHTYTRLHTQHLFCSLQRSSWSGDSVLHGTWSLIESLLSLHCDFPRIITRESILNTIHVCRKLFSFSLLWENWSFSFPSPSLTGNWEIPLYFIGTFRIKWK